MINTVKNGAVLLFAAAVLLTGCTGDTLVSSDLVPNESVAVSDPAETLAKTGKWTPFSATQETTSPSPPEMRRTGNGRVIHARGAEPSGTISGDIEGTFTSNWNGDHVLRDGVFTAPARGTGTFTVTRLYGEEVNGTFEIRAHGFNTLGVNFEGKLQGKGTGDLEGMKLMGTFEPIAPRMFALNGYIMDPRG